MENREFYIKYLDYQPVSIDTSYGRGLQGTLPLTTVAHLIAACSFEPTVKGQLGIRQDDYGPFTVHSISNGEETTYNSWDPLSVLGNNGTTGPNPLIIKSKKVQVQGIFNFFNI